MYKVLVIDPEHTYRALIGEILAGASPEIEIIGASGRAEGVRLARQRKPDAILLEVAGPRGDGWLTLETLKSEGPTRSIPVLVVSVLDEEARARRLGADAYVMKPFDVATLLTELGRFLPLGRPLRTPAGGAAPDWPCPSDYYSMNVHGTHI